MCIEMWVGCAVLTKEWVRLGFTGKACECKLGGRYIPDGDLTRPEVQIDLQDDLPNRRVYHSHLAVTCTTWIPLRALGGRTPTSRTRELPQGDGTLPDEVAGNREVAIAFWYILSCLQLGVFFALEHPIPSRLWLLPFISYILKVCHSVFIIDLDQCAWVKRPGDWEPHHGDVRTKRGPDSLPITHT